MSSYGKLLVADIVVPAGGWVFAWLEGATARSVTVPAATYSDVLAVGRALRDVLRAMGGGHTSDVVAINQVGRTTVTISGMTAERWVATTDALSDLLGFAESEAVASGALTGTLQVTHAWFPGCITHAASLTRGAGLVSGSFWIPVDAAVRQWSGSGHQRTVAPGQLPLRRALRWDIVSTDEVRDLDRGVAALWETHLSKRLHWYLDREDGTVDAYGTQGDPRVNTDGDGTMDWWLVGMVEPPKVSDVAGSSRWWTVELVVQAGPAT